MSAINYTKEQLVDCHISTGSIFSAIYFESGILIKSLGGTLGIRVIKNSTLEIKQNPMWKLIQDKNKYRLHFHEGVEPFTWNPAGIAKHIINKTIKRVFVTRGSVYVYTKNEIYIFSVFKCRIGEERDVILYCDVETEV
jgi:hypothetical protein